jgi:hypothetical protein
MKRKTRTKKTTAKSSNGKANASPNGQAAVAEDRFRKYLEPQFTQDLIAHMHRAKKAALKDLE